MSRKISTPDIEPELTEAQEARELVIAAEPTTLGFLARRHTTENALYLPDKLTYGEYEAIGKALSYVKNGSQWWWGDFLLFGEASYGDDYLQAITLSGLEASTVSNYSYVCKIFPPESRRPELSFGHHECVCSPKINPDQRERLLDLAEQEHLTREDLRKLVKKLLGQSETLAKTGKITIEHPVTVEQVVAVVDTYMSAEEKAVLITELGGYSDLGDMPGGEGENEPNYTAYDPENVDRMREHLANGGEVSGNGWSYPNTDEEPVALPNQMIEDEFAAPVQPQAAAEEDEDENPFENQEASPGFPPGYNPELFGVADDDDEDENPFTT